MVNFCYKNDEHLLTCQPDYQYVCSSDPPNGLFI